MNKFIKRCLTGGEMMFWRKKKTASVEAPKIDYDAKRRESIPQEELEILKKSLEKAYDYVQKGGKSSTYGGKIFPDGFESYRLSKPEFIMDCWIYSRDEMENSIFGLGGLNNISLDFVRRRCMFRISINVYGALGVEFPSGMVDYFESLTQMEVGDALNWLPKCK